VSSRDELGTSVVLMSEPPPPIGERDSCTAAIEIGSRRCLTAHQGGGDSAAIFDAVASRGPREAFISPETDRASTAQIRKARRRDARPRAHTAGARDSCGSRRPADRRQAIAGQLPSEPRDR